MSSPLKLNTNSSPSKSISAAQDIIGLTVAALLNIGLLFLGITSLGGAFLPGCPFRSAFSSVTRFIYEKPQTLLKWILGRLPLLERVRKLSVFVLALLGPLQLVAMFVILITNVVNTGIWTSLLFLTMTSFVMAIFAKKEVVHKPQKYKISHLALWAFLPISVLVTFAHSFAHADEIDDRGRLISVLIASLGEVIVYIPALLIYSQMSKSMAGTGEIDAMAWLLKTAPPQNPAAFFKKAAQMTGFDSIGCGYRPRLLESLMAFLTLLIISHQALEHPSSDTHSPSSSLSDDENLEIYIACLARLSDFADSEGSYKCLWEDAMQHPKLEQPLIDKMVVLANPRRRFQDGLRSAATKVLNNYELDMEGKSVGGPATTVESHGVASILRKAGSSVATFLGRADAVASWMAEPHLFGEIEEA
jgi:hypothetical protein